VLPTFNFNFTGFSGVTATAYQGALEWLASKNQFDSISVIATGNYLGSSTSITIPDLSALNGFIAPAPAGTLVSWVACIWGGPWAVDPWDGNSGLGFPYSYYTTLPATGSNAFARDLGSFYQP
jgi:hypothetical protein